MMKTLILKFTLIFILLIFVTLVSGAQPLLDQPINKVDLRAGETLEYSVKVKGIPAGSQIMQIKGQKTIGGKTVYHLHSYSSANSFFYLFYPFSDQVESYVLKDNFQPVKFQRNLIDGKYNGSTTINFDNSKLVAEIEKDKKRFEVKIPNGVQDELSMLYLIRLKKIEVGNEYEFSAIVGSKVYNIVVQVLRTEEIKTVLGKTKTIVLKSMPKDALLWITNDENRIPVRLEINTKLGKLVADLKAMS